MAETEMDWLLALGVPFSVVVLLYGLFAESVLLALIVVMLLVIVRVLYRIESSLPVERA